MSKAPIFVYALEPKGPIARALHLIFGQGSSLPLNPRQKATVGLVIATKTDGSDWAKQADEILDNYANCCGLVVAAPKEHVRTPGRPYLKNAFEAGVKVLDLSDPKSLLVRLLEARELLVNSWADRTQMSLVREVVRANRLYRLVEDFGHGGTRDITNQYLAPLKILLDAGVTDPASMITQDRNALLERFKSEVITKCEDGWWMSSSMKRAFEKLTPTEDMNKSDALAELMDLLTECRIYAGASSRNPVTEKFGEAATTKKRKSDHDWKFEILVIEDNKDEWKSVFTALVSAVTQSAPPDGHLLGLKVHHLRM